MISLFTTAKPFTGHSAVIQRNALESWKRLHADVEVILFGDDAGAAEVCRELGLRYEPAIERRKNGTKGLRSIFGRAQEIARHDILCYVNCDIILTSDFLRAITALSARSAPFLMIGRRWDVDVTLPLDFSQPAGRKPSCSAPGGRAFSASITTSTISPFAAAFMRKSPIWLSAATGGTNGWSGKPGPRASPSSTFPRSSVRCTRTTTIPITRKAWPACGAMMPRRKTSASPAAGAACTPSRMRRFV